MDKEIRKQLASLGIPQPTISTWVKKGLSPQGKIILKLLGERGKLEAKLSSLDQCLETLMRRFVKFGM